MSNIFTLTKGTKKFNCKLRNSGLRKVKSMKTLYA